MLKTNDGLLTGVVVAPHGDGDDAHLGPERRRVRSPAGVVNGSECQERNRKGDPQKAGRKGALLIASKAGQVAKHQCGARSESKLHRFLGGAVSAEVRVLARIVRHFRLVANAHNPATLASHDGANMRSIIPSMKAHAVLGLVMG